MTDVLLNPLYLAGSLVSLLLMVALAWFIWNSNRRMHERLALAALERGWHYEKAPARDIVYRLHGTSSDGVAWHLESFRSQSSSSSSSGSAGGGSTRWWTDAVSLPDNMVLVGPRLLTLPASLNLGGFLAQALLQFALGPDAARFAHVQDVPIDNETLRQHYTILSDNEKNAQEFVEATEAALMDWAMDQSLKKQVLMVLYWHQGLQIKLQSQITDVRVLDRLVQFGETLATSTLRLKTNPW